jgi:protein FRG1
MEKAKSMKLSFKGETKKKKRHREKPAPSKQGIMGEDDERSLDGWTMMNSNDDLCGPVMIISNATDSPSILFAHTELSQVAFRLLSDEESRGGLSSIEPNEVSQVFVLQQVPSSSPVRYTLKSAFDKYFGVDKFGLVSCEREAVGPSEEWEVIPKDGGFIMRSAYDKFMKIDLASKNIGVPGSLGTPQTQSKLLHARCDSETAGFLETFYLKCQTAQKRKSKKVKATEVSVEDSQYELEQL